MSYQPFIGIALFSFSIFFSACDQEDVQAESELSQLQITEESSFLENVSAQLSSDVEDATLKDSSNQSSRRRFGFLNCATRTVIQLDSLNEYPKTITWDYGSGCTSQGISRSGRILITLTGDSRQAGSQRIVTFEGFTINDYLFMGTKTITYEGNKSYTAILENGLIITPESEQITWEYNKSRVLVSGGDTEDTEDDVYEIYGSESGVTAEGTPYTKTITSPLIAPNACYMITSGTIEKTLGDESKVILDFGDGECDNLATRTQDGISEEFEMNFSCRKFGRRAS